MRLLFITIGSALLCLNGALRGTQSGFASGLRQGPSCALRDGDDYENTRGRFGMLNKCCQKYGAVYYNYEEGDWVPTPENEDDDGPASLRRFWHKMCEKYRTRSLNLGAEATSNEGADTTVKPKEPVSNPSRQTTDATPDDNSDEDDDTTGSSQGSGQSAATGNADAKNGSVISIIQATHDSNPFLSVQRSLSASSGTGTDLKLDGAAQNKGSFQTTNAMHSGESAASGQSNVQAGQGISINKADQQATAGETSGSSLSASAGSGQKPNSGGAAAAKGSSVITRNQPDPEDSSDDR